MVSGEGVGRGVRGRDTARLDASVHDVFRSVPACCSPRGSPSVMTVHMLAGAPPPTDVRCVCLNLEGGNKVDEEGFSVQGQAGCWRKACFSSAAVRKGALRDVGRRVQEPQPEDFPGAGSRGKVRCGGVPSSDSVCHSCATWARE